ncbi:hypothetical protein K9M74_05585 [Candidatus Woesearchaeota archaeon]|nr:hypothetical protein [Candidatus Woesearchaeota archaeon]
MKLSIGIAILLSFIAGMILAGLLSQMPVASASPEQFSPFDRITEEQVRVYQDSIIIHVENAKWASFTDTNSMDPFIDKGANALQIIPQTAEEIHIGDIITYAGDTGRIIHRVVYIGEDDAGWYCIVKGDNNKVADPGKIRFNRIDRVLFGVLY